MDQNQTLPRRQMILLLSNFLLLTHLALHGRYINILNFYLHIRLYYFC